MDKIVPNQFFDLFARVIPGGVLIFVLAHLDGPNLLKLALNFFVPQDLRGQQIPWLVVVVALCYACGCALSPLVKSIDVLDKHVRRLFRLSAPLEVTSQYNKLRFRYPARLTVATRIRAEYTMYGGIAAAIFVAELTALFVWMANGRPFPTMADGARNGVGMITCIAMAWRYSDVRQRFGNTVQAFGDASQSATMPQQDSAE